MNGKTARTERVRQVSQAVRMIDTGISSWPPWPR